MSFDCQDFVQKEQPRCSLLIILRLVPLSTAGCGRGVYDAVMCMSVTKWIHFNGGDDGLKNLFEKVCHIP